MKIVSRWYQAHCDFNVDDITSYQCFKLLIIIVQFLKYFSLKIMQIYLIYINGITNIKFNFTVSFYALKCPKLQTYNPPPVEKKSCKPTCTSIIANHAQYVQSAPTYMYVDSRTWHETTMYLMPAPSTPPPSLKKIWIRACFYLCL